MRADVGNSLMRVTATCEIKVRNVGRPDGCVVVEITQAKAEGGAVTTLLLCPDRARELASVLLRHSGGRVDPADGARATDTGGSGGG